MAQNTPLSAINLTNPITRNGDNSLTAPKNAITWEAAARTIYQGLRQQHVNRIVTYSGIEGLISGNPPYNPAELARTGLGHLTNYNDLTPRALYERTAQMYWNLFNQAVTLVQFKLSYPGPQGKDPNLITYAAKMSQHFTDVMREWSAFTVVMGTLTSQLVKFGVSPIIFPDEENWQFEVVEMAKFYVANQAESRLDKVTTFAVETPCTVQYLWRCYEDAGKNKSPWNKEALGDLLVQIGNGPTNVAGNTQPVTLFDLQTRYQNGDYAWTQYFNYVVPLVSLFQVEYDGEISHYKLHPNIISSTKTEDSKKQFIFFEDRQYKSISECLQVFTRSPGEMYIHGNRGLGHMIFSASQAKMQLDCNLVDIVKISSTPIISDQNIGLSTKDVDAIKLTPGVPINIGPRKFERNDMGSNIQQSLMVSNNIERMLEKNAMNTGDDTGGPDRAMGSSSPIQTKFAAYKEYGILKNAVWHFYSQMDVLWQNIIGKMFHSKSTSAGYDTAKEWKDRCLADGVPEEIFELGKSKDSRGKLPKHVGVHATRVAGAGSQLGLLLSIQDFLPFMGSVPAKGKRVIQEMAVTASFGPEYVNALTQSESEAAEQDGGSSVAGLENIAMQAGNRVVFSIDNNHEAHFMTHMGLGSDTIQKVQQQQMQPVQADQIMGPLIENMQQHLEALKQNIFSKGFLEQVAGPWREVYQWAQLNRKNAAAQLKAQIKQQQELQEQEQEVLSDASLKEKQLAMDNQIKNRKLDDQIARNERRDEVQAESTKAKTDLVRQKAATEAAAKDQKTQAEVAAIENKTAAQMSATEASSRLKALNGKSPSPNNFE